MKRAAPIRNVSRKAQGPDAGGWQPGLTGLHCPPRLADWLQERRSLTARILRQAPSGTAFSVTVLRQGLALPLADEAVLIGGRADRRVLVRDVVLSLGGRAVIYAHTVLAPDQARHPWPWLDRIGQRPLGSILFTRHDIVAGPHRYRGLDRRHPLYRAAAPWSGTPTPARLPARRACFFLQGSPLLVTEVYLPSLLELCAP
ncbi:hypothetical protein DLREEDagrD3_03550 [Denitratisoma sp. agr-D3]